MRVLAPGECRYSLALDGLYLEITTTERSEIAELEILAMKAKRVAIEMRQGVHSVVERVVGRSLASAAPPRLVPTRQSILEDALDRESIALLNTFKGNVHGTNKRGMNGMHISALNGKYDSLKWCIANGIGRYGIDKELHTSENTSLMLACHGGQLGSDKSKRAACVGLLLLAGADPQKQNHDGDTALHFAIRAGLADTLKIFANLPLDLRSYLFSIKNKAGRSPLDEIEVSSLHDSVKEVLCKVAAKSVPSPTSVPVDLVKLREIIRSDIPKLEFGSAIEAVYRQPRIKLRKPGVIPAIIVEVPIGDYLASAARRGDIDCLTRYSQYLHHVDYDGRNAFMSACAARTTESLEWLLKNYTEKTGIPLLDALNLRDDYGCISAHFAATGGKRDNQGEPDCMKLLMDKGVNVNVVDNAGFTPLLVAAQNLYPKIVKELMTNPDCNLDVILEGQSPLSLARLSVISEDDETKYSEIEKLLNRTAVAPAVHLASKVTMVTGKTAKSSMNDQKAIDSLVDVIKSAIKSVLSVIW